MKTNKKLRIAGRFLSLAAISLATVWLGGSGSLAGDINPMASQKSAPNWELTDLAGKTVRAADFQGKVVVLDFWATWCPPCREEIPGFIELQQKYQAQGLAVIGVSVDQADAGTVKAFAEKLGINYPVVLADAKTPNVYDIEVLPSTFIIDRAGHIVKQHLGFTPKSEIEAEIKPLLKP
jgi:cytochrome c biogenesis protein CcmG/thiol:disulfide interchange protein DsbE